MAAPSPTAAPTPVRYSSTSNIRVASVPTMANFNTPTSAEITAGTDWTAWIGKAGVTGFDVTPATVPTDDILTGVDFQLTDGQSISGSPQISFKRSKTKTGAPELYFTYGLAINLVLCDAPTWATTGALCGVWPVTVSAVSWTWQGEALYVVSFQPSAVPARGIAVPTA